MKKTTSQRTRVCKAYNITTVKRKFSWGDRDVLELGDDSGWIKRIPAITAQNGDLIKITRDIESREIKLTKTMDMDDGCWIAHISEDSSFVQNEQGITVPFPKKSAQKLAEGRGIYVIGNVVERWDDTLFEIEDNAFVFVKPIGFRSKPYILHFTPFGVEQLTRKNFKSYLDGTSIQSASFGDDIVSFLQSHAFL